jgi:hypothetical protein
MPICVAFCTTPSLSWTPSRYSSFWNGNAMKLSVPVFGSGTFSAQSMNPIWRPVRDARRCVRRSRIASPCFGASAPRRPPRAIPRRLSVCVTDVAR